MLRPTKTHHSCADEELATIVTLLSANTSLGHVFSVWRVFLSMCWRACSPSKADRTSFVIACITDTINALVPSLLFGIPPKELHGWLKDSVSLTCVWGLSVTQKCRNVVCPIRIIKPSPWQAGQQDGTTNQHPPHMLRESARYCDHACILNKLIDHVMRLRRMLLPLFWRACSPSMVELARCPIACHLLLGVTPTIHIVKL